MQIPTVFRCVDILSGTIASLPLELRKNDGSGLFRLYENDPMHDIFRGVANERQTFYELMYNAISRRYLLGNSFILPRWRGTKLEELVLVDGVSYDPYKNEYYVNDPIQGIEGRFPAHEIIHIRNRSLDGFIGDSTIRYASNTLTLSKVSDEQTLRGIHGGNKMKGFITGGEPRVGFGEIADDVVDRVAVRLENDLRLGKDIVRIPGSLDFKPFTMSPQDVELLATRKYTTYDICRFFGVHPDMVFVEVTGNYKASENVQITFLQQTLAPVLKQISSEFTAKLIPPSMRRRYRIEYDTEAMLLNDSVGRSEYYKRMIESGVLTPNEVRRKEGRASVAGGDSAFISCNVAPLVSSSQEPAIAGKE